MFFIILYSFTIQNNCCPVIFNSTEDLPNVDHETSFFAYITFVLAIKLRRRHAEGRVDARRYHGQFLNLEVWSINGAVWLQVVAIFTK